VIITNDQFDQCARWIPITSWHRHALLSTEKLLVNKITVNGALLDKLSLCKRRKEAIETAATGEEQVKTLINIVSRQPDFAFTQLLDALINTQQTEAADIINHGTKIAIKTEDSELPRVITRDEWKEVDNNLEYLLRSIRKCHSYQQSGIIFPALIGVVTAVHSLRERQSLSTLRNIEETIAEELERLMLPQFKEHPMMRGLLRAPGGNCLH